MGRKPFSARITKYVKNPAVACIIPNREEEEQFNVNGCVWIRYYLNIFEVSLWIRTDLSVGYADEPLIHQLVCFGVSGLSLHDVALSCFISQGDGRDLGDNK